MDIFRKAIVRNTSPERALDQNVGLTALRSSIEQRAQATGRKINDEILLDTIKRTVASPLPYQDSSLDQFRKITSKYHSIPEQERRPLDSNSNTYFLMLELNGLKDKNRALEITNLRLQGELDKHVLTIQELSAKLGLIANQNNVLEVKSRVIGEDTKTNILVLDARLKDLEARNQLLVEQLNQERYTFSFTI